jgi:hypothetical protein
VLAAVTPEEAANLGDSLTLFGAIRAGNAEGTIAEDTGGLAKPPAGAGLDANGWLDSAFDFMTSTTAARSQKTWSNPSWPRCPAASVSSLHPHRLRQLLSPSCKETRYAI